jgi:hypothetical protein
MISKPLTSKDSDSSEKIIIIISFGLISEDDSLLLLSSVLLVFIFEGSIFLPDKLANFC